MRSILAALLVVVWVFPAAADGDSERARGLSPTALQQVLAGFGAYERGDYPGAVETWQQVVGVAPHRVQYLYAGILYDGLGIEADPATAAEALTEAANHGHAKGQYMLGLATRAAGDDATGLQWVIASAEQEWPAANFALGHWYERGDGVDRDNVEALVRYRRAAASGHPSAAEFALSLLSRMTDEERAAAVAR
jgi:TPR repeat protein